MSKIISRVQNIVDKSSIGHALQPAGTKKEDNKGNVESDAIKSKSVLLNSGTTLTLKSDIDLYEYYVNVIESSVRLKTELSFDVDEANSINNVLFTDDLKPDKIFTINNFNYVSFSNTPALYKIHNDTIFSKIKNSINEKHWIKAEYDLLLELFDFIDLASEPSKDIEKVNLIKDFDKRQIENVKQAQIIVDEIIRKKCKNCERCCIAFNYLCEGCETRAALMQLLVMSFNPQSKKFGNIGDGFPCDIVQIDGEKLLTVEIDGKIFTWGHHQAILITIKDEDEQFVVDPPKFSTPIKLSLWVASIIGSDSPTITIYKFDVIDKKLIGKSWMYCERPAILIDLQSRHPEVTDICKFL